MPDLPALTLHVLPPSHPCMTAREALLYKGLDFEEVVLAVDGSHPDRMAEVYGEGNTTVPGLVIGDRPVHGSVPILRALEELQPVPSLYPAPIAEQVREAEEWGDRELQDLGRRLPWGALHFKPWAMGTFGGGGPLDPAGTDFAMKFLRANWRYHRISASQLAEDLAGLPAKVEHIESLAAAGIIGGADPNAADLQIGATVRVLLCIADIRPLFETGRAAEIARRWFPDYAGEVPTGAFPAEWLATSSS